MDELRSREWVALAALAVAVMIAFSFCNPAAGRNNVQRPISHGEAVPWTPEPRPTPTPVPTANLPTPTSWFVRYLTSNEPGRGVDDGFGYVDTLDFAYEGPPYPGLRDDNWMLTAATTWELPPGRYAFTLERDCELIITINGMVVRNEPDAEGTDHLRIVFDHHGGEVRLTISAMDRGGPFVLRWS